MDIIAQLKRDEGVRLHVYTDTVGKATIGTGRNLVDVGISYDEADLLLSNDISRVSVQLAAAFPWTSSLDDARRGALLNMTFNLGIGGVAAFHDMLTAAQAGNWEAAAEAMLNSKWAEQVGARAQRLSLQIRTGMWQ